MLLENLAIGRSVEIFADRDGYCYHLTSKIEETSAKRLYITLIATNTRAFEFRPEDKIRIVYRDKDQIWEWANVKAGIVKKYGVKMHYFDIVDGGRSFNRRNAYRVAINEEVMLGYYDQYGTTAKSADMQKFKLSDEASAPPAMMVPNFVKGVVRDISATGVGICSNYEFSIDDAMFFSISSSYGSLPAKARVVRKVATNPSNNKYSNYYGCVLLQTDNKLSKHIADIQREAIKTQRQKRDEEELDKALGRLEKGILNNSIKKQPGKKNAAHGIKGIKTAADMEKARENQKQRPRPKIEGIRTAADEEEKKDIKKQPRPKVEGIVTMDEVQEKLEKKKDNTAPPPQIEGIKTAGLK
ncbi:MAG: PilZ domain-containing protein [Lachnospiraceae bacterium]|nr:PilZ domain-containing protein [Lachnospiraceae bacterium]